MTARPNQFGAASSKVVSGIIVVAVGIGAIAYWNMFESQRLSRRTDDAKQAIEELRAMTTPAPSESADGTAEPETASVPAQTVAPSQAAAADDTGIPDSFKVKFETTKGDVIAEFNKEHAPNGVTRIYELVKSGYFDGCKFFRVVPGFVVQFGIAADPQTSARWREQTLQDDPVRQSNITGTITFAKSDLPNSRSTQLFINLGDNLNLDALGFAPVGKVVEGMDVVLQFNSQYADQPTGHQGQIHAQGNAYLDKVFPGLDSVVKATIIE